MSRDTTDDQTVVAEHVARLDPDARGALVADLWAARGYETTRDSGLVTAKRDGRTVRIRVGGDETDLSADAVAEPEADTDTRVFDAGGLAERLFYAVDRSVTRELCERHLGAPPSDLDLPVSVRVRRRLPSASVAAIVAVVVLAGAVAVAGLPMMNDAGDVEPASSPAEPAADTRLASQVAAAPPPGVDSAGIRDLDRLAAAHEAAVTGRPHTVWIDRGQPQFANGSVTTATLDIDIASDGERHLTTVSREEDGERVRLGTLYHTGQITYARVRTGANVSYRSVTPAQQQRDGIPSPGALAGQVVTQYLSTPETRLTGTVERDGLTLYRIVATGQPTGPAFGNVLNYTAVAFVSAQGLVYDLTAEYTVLSPGRRYELSREITYGRVGSTTVRTPAWYEKRFGNATG